MNKKYIRTTNETLFNVLKNLNSYKSLNLSDSIISKITKDINKLTNKGYNIKLIGNKLELLDKDTFQVYKENKK